MFTSCSCVVRGFLLRVIRGESLSTFGRDSFNLYLSIDHVVLVLDLGSDLVF